MTKNKVTIEEKIEQLDKQIAWFDSEEFQIEQAIEKYTAAQKLAEEITQDIDSMKNEIKVVSGQ